ncbi:MAG: pyridoxamine 5'-phosphate oxidase family protein [Dehalococcoidia bacterium]
MTAEQSTSEKIAAFLALPRNAMVAAIRRDGRPQMTPNWFIWDGSRFYVSTTKTRQKFKNFSRDPRVQLAFDDPTGFMCVVVDGTVEIWDDHARGLPYFRQLTIKHRGQAPDDATILERLKTEQRVLLVITPDKPVAEWTNWGF